MSSLAAVDIKAWTSNYIPYVYVCKIIYPYSKINIGSAKLSWYNFIGYEIFPELIA